MTTYISLLRGINVGGRNIIKMEFLQKLFEDLDFQNVKSYVQSGNIVFSKNESKNHVLELKITQQIEKIFQMTIPVFVLTIQELKNIINENPFAQNSTNDPAFMHIIFLSSSPKLHEVESILKKRQSEEKIHITENAVYLYCPNGYGETKLSNNFLEKKLSVNTTTRNWKTCKALLSLAESSLA